MDCHAAIGNELSAAGVDHGAASGASRGGAEAKAEAAEDEVKEEPISPVSIALAEYVSTALDRELPPAVTAKTKLHVLDTMAAMVSGSRLKAGEFWRYEPPTDHTICWVALASGRLAIPETAEAGELVAFETSNQAIGFRAEADTEFVLGSAAGHPYELVLGYYSVHTSPASLHAGEQRIAEIKARLQKEGRL